MSPSPTPKPRASAVVMRGHGDERHGLISTSSAVACEREAFDALLSLVVSKERPRYAYRVVSEYPVVAILGGWRGGGRSQDEAREALKDVIRAGLIQQTGGTDAP